MQVIQHEERTLKDHDASKFNDNLSSIRKPMVNANNFDIKLT